MPCSQNYQGLRIIINTRLVEAYCLRFIEFIHCCGHTINVVLFFKSIRYLNIGQTGDQLLFKSTFLIKDIVSVHSFRGTPFLIQTSLLNFSAIITFVKSKFSAGTKIKDTDWLVKASQIKVILKWIKKFW